MGNANYGVDATFAIEQVLPTAFQNVAELSHPFLAKIIGRGDTPSANFMVESRTFGGTKLLMPVSLELPGDVEGVTHAGMWTDQTVTQPSSGEATQAEYNFASYRGGVRLDARDIRLLSNNPQSRKGIDIITQRVSNMVSEFKSDIETDLSGDSVDAEDSVLGMRFGLDTSASPGNISQTTFSDWAAVVDAVDAAYSIARVLRGINGTRQYSTMGMKVADCLFASESASGYIFSAIQNDIGANTLMSDKALGNFGHLHFVLQNNTAVLPQTVVTKENYFFRSENWAYVGDEAPQVLEPSPTRDKGSVILDWAYTWMVAVGCNDWKRQSKQTGMSTS